MDKPKTLRDAIRYFQDEQVCINAVAELRWPNGPVCPKCGHCEHYYLATQKRWKCKACKKQFSVKVGTIFEDSPIPLDKWLIALWMLVNCKNGVSSYEVARALGVTQKSAWFMLHRLRLALQTKSLVKLGGHGSEVEVDETFIGGKARNMHPKVHQRRIVQGGPHDKTIVMGLLERGGEVRTMVLANRRKPLIQKSVRENVTPMSVLLSDRLQSYEGLIRHYAHYMIDHAERYVDGKVHTNGMENFWSLLKRGLKGTYVAVEPFHLFRYLDEQVFRYNYRKNRLGRKLNDGERFDKALSQIAGKRLTFAEVTGKVGESAVN
ncbi:MAG TPA: IS1595 family transposase [Candidatus Angelobacter sp.]|nr:IS1595 family transposase [Candidatus Angelobacter sp.]